MAKERELKEAVREGRDRVRQEGFLPVICFVFCHFLCFFRELNHVTNKAGTDENLGLNSKNWMALGDFFLLWATKESFFFKRKH